MYEDYMQNLFNTYDQMPKNTGYYNQMNDCDCYAYEPIWPYDYMPNMTRNTFSKDLEDLYPEIYKVIYPMVKKACKQITRPVDEDLIDEMTQDIYSHLEAGNIINVNINVDNDNTVNSINRTETPRENRNVTSRNITQSTNKIPEKSQENRSNEDRQFGNSTLRDLIRILLLRELIGRPDYNRPPRPPFPGPRPPIPPRPPMSPRPDNSRLF